MMRYVDGQSLAQVAEATGLTVNTVSKQVTRGLQRLRMILKEPP